MVENKGLEEICKEKYQADISERLKILKSIKFLSQVSEVGTKEQFYEGLGDFVNHYFDTYVHHSHESKGIKRFYLNESRSAEEIYTRKYSPRTLIIELDKFGILRSMEKIGFNKMISMTVDDENDERNVLIKYFYPKKENKTMISNKRFNLLVDAYEIYQFFSNLERSKDIEPPKKIKPLYGKLELVYNNSQYEISLLKKEPNLKLIKK